MSFCMGCRPSPVPGSTKELGFLGSVLHVELPRDLDEQQLGNGPRIQAVADQDRHVCSNYLSPFGLLYHN